VKIVEVQARTVLNPIRQPDPIFGLRYTLNLYRGCQHHCIYCDSRSACYNIADFDGEIQVKTTPPQLLDQELARKRTRGTIGTGSMNDPYMPLETHYRLTRAALSVIARHGFPVHVLTKSDLVLQDLPLLQEIHKVYAAVTFTITTPADDLAARIEPAAPSPTRRFQAVEALASAGLYTGIALMPALPWITDRWEDLSELIRRAAGCGAQYILPLMAVTLRDRQREHYYAQLDRHFPGLRSRYERQFGLRYTAWAPHSRELFHKIGDLCSQLGLACQITPYQPAAPAQPALF